MVCQKEVFCHRETETERRGKREGSRMGENTSGRNWIDKLVQPTRKLITTTAKPQDPSSTRMEWDTKTRTHSYTGVCVGVGFSHHISSPSPQLCPTPLPWVIACLHSPPGSLAMISLTPLDTQTHTHILTHKYTHHRQTHTYMFTRILLWVCVCVS